MPAYARININTKSPYNGCAILFRGKNVAYESVGWKKRSAFVKFSHVKFLMQQRRTRKNTLNLIYRYGKSPNFSTDEYMIRYNKLIHEMLNEIRTLLGEA